jgi:hypothetical protein
MMRVAKLLALLGAAALLWACTPPTQPTQLPPGSTNVTQIVTIGGSPPPNGCKNPDRVDISAPTSFTHGLVEDIQLIPSLGGQVQSGADICGVVWFPPGGPCTIQNPSNLSTTMSATASGSCTAQGQVGTVQSVSIVITVN